jgi:hypothetical protein
MKALLAQGRALLALALVLAGLALSGCATTEESENASSRPWNQPRGWETGLPSSMYDRRY